MPDHDHGPADAIPVESLGIDGFETGLLAMTRHFMSAFARPEGQAWQHAHLIAAQRWGEVEGPQIAYRLLTVIQTLRQQRQREFHFANPLCVKCRDLCTPDEAAFCQMLHAMRRDRTDLARHAMPALTDGRVDPLLVQVSLAFAARFPASAAERAATTAPLTEPTSDLRRGAQRAPHLRLLH